ncbi:MAG: hypothetical protein ACK595_15585 [Planctomycetota bacterium]
MLLTGWKRQMPLCNPMCGSATFLVEAAWLATDRATGLGRRFAFERWKDVDVDAWRKLFDDAEARAQRGASKLPPICGNDRHPGDIAEFVPPTRPEMVVTNPPYGDRLQSDPVALEQSWSALGRFLHTQCQGAMAWVLCGNAEVTRLLGLRATEKLPLKNGPIDCRWLKYEVDERVRE